MESGNTPKAPKRILPKIEDLMKNPELASEYNDYHRLINAEPKREWLREHHQAKRKVYDANGNKIEVPALFMPIGIQEYLMTAIYGEWKRDIKSVSIHANSEVTIMRVWYLHPVTEQWEFTDGVGASPVHTSKGAGATDFDKINTYSVQTAAPSSASYAFKDAVENLGKIFGKDVNRLDNMNYEVTLDKQYTVLSGKMPLPDELKAVIAEIATPDELSKLYLANPEFHANAEFMPLLNARRLEISTRQIENK